MAFSEKASAHKVVAFIDSSTSTSAITVRAGRLVDIAVDIGSGDTVKLEGEYELKNTSTFNDKVWHVIETYTTDQAKVLRFATERRLRITQTAGTGGTTIELTAGNKV